MKCLPKKSNCHSRKKSMRKSIRRCCQWFHCIFISFKWFSLLNINLCVYGIDSDCYRDEQIITTHSLLHAPGLSFPNHINNSNNDLLMNAHMENFLRTKCKYSTYRHSLTSVQTRDCCLSFLMRTEFYKCATWNWVGEKEWERERIDKKLLSIFIRRLFFFSFGCFLNLRDPPTTLLSFHSVRAYTVSTNSNTLSLKLDNCVKMLTRAHLMMFIQQRNENLCQSLYTRAPNPKMYSVEMMAERKKREYNTKWKAPGRKINIHAKKKRKKNVHLIPLMAFLFNSIVFRPEPEIN